MTTATLTKPGIVATLRDPESRAGKVARVAGWLALIIGGVYLAEKRADAKYERGFRVGYELGRGGDDTEEER